MPAPTPNRPLCRDCDGFPVVAITTGTRNLDGTRVTLAVTCSTCKGTGRRTASALIRAGR
jgi:DnaJ-class molecular chaperone